MSATEKQGQDTVGFSTFDNDQASGRRRAREAISLYSRNDIPDPFRYLADDEPSLGLDADGSKYPDFTFGNPLPTPYDQSPSDYLPSSSQEQEQAPWMPFATPSTTSAYEEIGRNSEDDVIPPAASKVPQGASDRPTDSHKNPDQATSHGKSKEVHDCEAHAIKILRSLHRWPLYSPDMLSEIMSSNHTQAVSETCLDNGHTNPEVFYSLDTILYANKRALLGVDKLLDCSCVQHPHLATLYISIITKMLSLYEIAVTTDVSSADCANSTASMASATHTSSGPRLAHNLTIQVGVFDLDEEDQAILQRGLLLQQLGKMERVIDKFASLDSGDPRDHDISVRQWLSVATSMIKKELQRVCQSCKEKLSMIR